MKKRLQKKRADALLPEYKRPQFRRSNRREHYWRKMFRAGLIERVSARALIATGYFGRFYGEMVISHGPTRNKKPYGQRRTKGK